MDPVDNELLKLMHELLLSEKQYIVQGTAKMPRELSELRRDFQKQIEELRGFVEADVAPDDDYREWFAGKFAELDETLEKLRAVPRGKKASQMLFAQHEATVRRVLCWIDHETSFVVVQRDAEPSRARETLRQHFFSGRRFPARAFAREILIAFGPVNEDVEPVAKRLRPFFPAPNDVAAVMASNGEAPPSVRDWLLLIYALADHSAEETSKLLADGDFRSAREFGPIIEVCGVACVVTPEFEKPPFPAEFEGLSVRLAQEKLLDIRGWASRKLEWKGPREPDRQAVETAADCPDKTTGSESRTLDDPPKTEATSTDVLQKFAELAPDGATVMKLAKIISDTSKIVNDRMVEASELNPELYLRRSPWWADTMNVSGSAITKTDYWTRIRKDVLEKQAELRRKQLEERTS